MSKSLVARIVRNASPCLGFMAFRPATRALPSHSLCGFQSESGPTRYLVACLVNLMRLVTGEPVLSYGPSCQTRGWRSFDPYPLAFHPFAPSSLRNPALLVRTTLRSAVPAGSRFGVSRCCKTDIATLGTLCQNPRSGHVSSTPKNPLQLSDLHKRQIAIYPLPPNLGSSLSTRYLDSDKDTHPCTTRPLQRTHCPGKR